MKSNRSRRQQRSFRPCEWIGASTIPLESRFLATDVPGFVLNTPIAGIQSWAWTTQQPNFTPLLDQETNSGDGTENTDAKVATGWLPPNSTGEASVAVEATNQLFTVGNPAAGFAIAVNFTLDNSLTVNTPVRPGYFGYVMESGAASGSGNFNPRHIPDSFSFVDTSHAGLPGWNSIKGNPPVYLSGSFSLSYTPHPTNNSTGFDILGGPNQNGVVQATGIFFESAATGVSLTGPVADTATGAADSLLATYPTAANGGGYRIVTQFYDNFFINGGNAGATYATTSTASGESIAYDGAIQTDYGTFNAGAGKSLMNFHFGENIGT